MLHFHLQLLISIDDFMLILICILPENLFQIIFFLQSNFAVILRGCVAPFEKIKCINTLVYFDLKRKSIEFSAHQMFILFSYFFGF